ncbi:glycosyltransferase family 4 protein [Pseudoalteromonas sp. KG3]|uniref:glycosyltransferase family 4 protein n=1 Tax=Pseudoalteromonas sp. KG3 TaxID=2951137 RepID=UPI00265A425C|nr:glycosyltransferase family 4 protein [Pseudoalteromonas sp. KG3]WKD22036.1 glycosyltransferase family 4 protein [Pseudoalteromonas sp. KG3]
MGSKKSNPTLGLFVDKQVALLKRKVEYLSYFYMKFNGDSLFHKAVKYPYFFISFFIQHVFSIKKYDIIHVHYYYPTIITALIYKYCRNQRVKIIVTCHGGDIYCYDPPKTIYKRLSTLVDHWIFTSAALQKRFFKPVKNASVICAGYDDAVYQYNDVDDKSIDCIIVGSLDHNKGLDRFITLVKTYPNLRFAVVGSGSYHTQLIKLEQKTSNLTYFGSLEPHKLKAAISSSHLLLSLSRNESFGLVISEAHALGVPCIATKTDGSLAQIHDDHFIIKQTGDVAESEIVESIYLSVDRYLSLPPQQQNVIRTKLAKDAKVFSLSKATSLIVDCYNQLLGTKNA